MCCQTRTRSQTLQLLVNGDIPIMVRLCLLFSRFFFHRVQASSVAASLHSTLPSAVDQVRTCLYIGCTASYCIQPHSSSSDPTGSASTGMLNLVRLPLFGQTSSHASNVDISTVLGCIFSASSLCGGFLVCGDILFISPDHPAIGTSKIKSLPGCSVSHLSAGPSESPACSSAHFYTRSIG